MYSKSRDFSKFLTELDGYIKQNNIKFSETSYTLLDILIEDPNMQRLIAIWLSHNNEPQLNYLFNKTLPNLGDLDPETQESAINYMFKRARDVSDLIPAPTDMDIVLDSMGERTTNKWDGWADFNRPLFACSEQDIQQLSKYSFFINNGIFTANKVLAMNISECASFDARVDHIIETNADFIYPNRIFTDKLINLIKKDVICQEILSSIGSDQYLQKEAIQPKVYERSESEPGIPAESGIDLLSVSESDLPSVDSDSDSEFDLVAHLNTKDKDESDNKSVLSDISTEDNLNITQISRDSTVSTAEAEPGFWQLFNIELYNLQKLIRLGQLTVSDIPNRELNPNEIAQYSLMNRLLQDLYPDIEQDDEYSVDTSPETYMETQKRAAPPARPQSPTVYTLDPNRSQQASHSWFDEKKNYTPPPAPKKEFHAGLKQPTHNVRLQKHIRDEDRIQKERLNREPKGMPRWHQEYKEMMRQRQQANKKDEDQRLDTGHKPIGKLGKY